MHTLLPTSLVTCKVPNFTSTKYRLAQNKIFNSQSYIKDLTIRLSSNKLDSPSAVLGDDPEGPEAEGNADRNLEDRDIDRGVSKGSASTSPASAIDKDLRKVVSKTAATFAPRASTATKNPAKPGTTLYSVFELQGYASMIIGGALSFNLIFPSNEPDIWRLMGMWSVWMFTIPSLRARDCSNKEKEALNYLFLLIPLLNVAIPFFWKSFAVVWSSDIVAFLGMYAWKLGWLQKADE